MAVEQATNLPNITRNFPGHLRQRGSAQQHIDNVLFGADPTRFISDHLGGGDDGAHNEPSGIFAPNLRDPAATGEQANEGALDHTVALGRAKDPRQGGLPAAPAETVAREAGGEEELAG